METRDNSEKWAEESDSCAFRYLSVCDHKNHPNVDDYKKRNECARELCAYLKEKQAYLKRTGEIE